MLLSPSDIRLWGGFYNTKHATSRRLPGAILTQKVCIFHASSRRASLLGVALSQCTAFLPYGIRGQMWSVNSTAVSSTRDVERTP